MRNEYTLEDTIDFLGIDFTNIQSALETHESIANDLKFFLHSYEKTDTIFDNWYHETMEEVNSLPEGLKFTDAGAKAVYQHLCTSVNENPTFDNLGLKLSVVTGMNNNQEVLKGLRYNITVGESEYSETLNVKNRIASMYAGGTVFSALEDAWKKELFPIIESKFENYDMEWFLEDYRSGEFSASEMKQTVETGMLTKGITDSVQKYQTPVKDTKENVER